MQKERGDCDGKLHSGARSGDDQLARHSVRARWQCRRTRAAAVSAVFDQFKACDILGHVKEVAPYLEQKLDELVEKYDFLITRRGKGLMQGVVCKLPVGKVAAAALEQGLIVITAGADVLRFVPPLVIEKQHVDEMIEKLEKALLSVQE